MQRMLVTLVALVMTVAPAGAAPVPGRAGSALASTDLATTAALVERLVIAVPDAGPEPDAPSTGDLASRLHLADPAADVVVMTRGDAPRTVGSFRVSPDAAALRVETATGQSFRADLPAIPAGDGHLTVVEVLGGNDGIVAWRTGDLVPSFTELRLPTWRLPADDANAVALDGAWWSLAAEVAVPAATLSVDRLRQIRTRIARAPVSRLRRLVDASVGDVTADGVPDLVLSFRRPFQRTLLNVSRPRRAWVDARGMSAHVGLFRPTDLSSIWVAGTLVRPVHRLAACTGALAVTYSTLRRPAVVAATVWAWQGFGFLPLPELPGVGRPTCIDIDLDGRPEAAIVERS